MCGYSQSTGRQHLHVTRQAVMCYTALGGSTLGPIDRCLAPSLIPWFLVLFPRGWLWVQLYRSNRRFNDSLKEGNPVNYADRTLSCTDCSQPFIFSADDQSYHAEMGYTNEPKRCPDCRRSRRSQRSGDSFGGGYDRGPREMHPAVCAECGKDTTVPFRPRGDRPVYCNDCFRQRGRPTASRNY